MQLPQLMAAVPPQHCSQLAATDEPQRAAPFPAAARHGQLGGVRTQKPALQHGGSAKPQPCRYRMYATAYGAPAAQRQRQPQLQAETGGDGGGGWGWGGGGGKPPQGGGGGGEQDGRHSDDDDSEAPASNPFDRQAILLRVPDRWSTLLTRDLTSRCKDVKLTNFYSCCLRATAMRMHSTCV